MGEGGFMVRRIWEVIIYLCLFALLFYAGAMTGIAYESRRLVSNERRMEKIDNMVRESAGRIAAVEAIVKKKKK